MRLQKRVHGSEVSNYTRCPTSPTPAPPRRALCTPHICAPACVDALSARGRAQAARVYM